jgi:hypothetical protein
MHAMAIQGKAFVKFGAIYVSTYLTPEEQAQLDAEIDVAEDADGGFDEVIIKRAAALAAAGASKTKLRQELSLTQYRVNKIYKDELFKRLVAEVGDDAISTMKSLTRSKLSAMQAKAMKALEDHLDKKSLEAVKVWLRAVGLDQTKDSDDKGGGFTLVLANQKPEPQTIIVKQEEDE